ncbi:MAG: GntR family transcriptional regulator [Desulfobacterales bacterium]
MNFKTLKHVSERKSLGDHVFENLKQVIIRGEAVPGTRLVESRIADAMDISRTPVREAMHKLEREGLIEKLPRGGFSVLGLTREEIEETFGIRSVLESYAASLSALNYQEGALLPLEEKISEYEMYLQKKQLEILPKINTEFHDLLYALSRSPKLNRMINHLRDQIYRFRQILLKDERMAQVSNADHRQMVALIRKKDAEGVEQLVREHILRGQAAVLKEFDKLSVVKED